MPKRNTKTQKCKEIRKRELQRAKAEKRREKKPKTEPNSEKREPETLERKRVITPDLILEDNKALDEEEAFDEFSPFFQLEKEAKILLTTSEKPTRESFSILQELKCFIPNSFYYPRQFFALSEMAREALKRDFTHIIVVTERLKKAHSIFFAVLGSGPTLSFRIRKYVSSDEIPNKGRLTGYEPEIIVKNFHTALGRRVGRAFASLFNLSPDFKGRTVATVYNFRDFIFFRHHRYIFRRDEREGRDVRAALQEIGPRIILQLRKVHSGCFDEEFGNFEFFYKGRHYVKRTRFFL